MYRISFKEQVGSELLRNGQAPSSNEVWHISYFLARDGRLVSSAFPSYSRTIVLSSTIA